jgi:hypothetical protein
MGLHPLRAAVLVAAAGCSGKDSASGEAGGNAAGTALLLPHDAWSYVPPDSDPFAEAAGEPCPSIGYAVEGGFLEIETDYCAVATFTQRLPEDLRAGSFVRFVVWNLDLWAPEPFTAQRVLRCGSVDLWQVETAVPGDESVEEVSLTVSEALPVGTDCFFHLQNHGVNSWRLGDVERGPG